MSIIDAQVDAALKAWRDGYDPDGADPRERMRAALTAAQAAGDEQMRQACIRHHEAGVREGCASGIEAAKGKLAGLIIKAQSAGDTVAFNQLRSALVEVDSAIRPLSCASEDKAAMRAGAMRLGCCPIGQCIDESAIRADERAKFEARPPSASATAGVPSETGEGELTNVIYKHLNNPSGALTYGRAQEIARSVLALLREAKK